MIKKKILITGGSGRLGKYVLENLNRESFEIFAPSSKEINLLDSEISAKIEKYSPDVILHMAAFTDVKVAESNFLPAIETNVLGTINILKYAIQKDIDFIYISTDAVFDGEKGDYRPSDPVNPQNRYAKTKTAGELVCRTYPKSTIIRTAFFEYTFPYDAAFYDQYTSKDYLDILGPKIIKVVENHKPGIYHIGSPRHSIYDIAVARRDNVIKKSRHDFNFIILKDTSFNEEDTYGSL